MLKRVISVLSFGVVALHATFEVPPLAYDFGDLEPYIPKKIMQIHHDKHHAGYVDGLNATVSEPGFERYSAWDLTKLLLYVHTLPEAIRDDVRFYAGGHANHAFFWRTLCPAKMSRPPKGELRKAIDRDFGSFPTFQDAFSHVASGVRGSGWAWLVIKKDGRLAVKGTHNHDTPLSYGEIPILVLDVWEHAYYLQYTHKRGSYIQNWWNVVNWDFVERLYRMFAIENEPITKWFTHASEIPYTSNLQALAGRRNANKKARAT